MGMTFDFQVFSPGRHWQTTEATSFRGKDASGGFGLLARRSDFMTVLEYGLATLKWGSGELMFFGFPGGVLRFSRGSLQIVTRFYVQGPNPAELLTSLAAEVKREQERVRELKTSVRRLDEELLRRLRQMEG